jgi:hypothetical protein
MSDSGSNDPYDPNRPSQPGPDQPQWGSTPPSQPEQPGYYTPPQAGQPQYGQPPYGGQYGQPGQPGQPGQYGQPPGSPPPNYLVPAILVTIFCCLPLGIASIVFAAQVNGKYAAGDIAGAQDASRKAKTFAIWSAVVGVVLGALYAVLVIAASTG